MTDWVFVGRAVLTATLGVVVYLAGLAVYNLYFHPLAKYPGPRWAAVTRFWMIYLEVVQGESLGTKLFDLHALYGDIVRIGPNELHFSQPSVYNEIFNARNRWAKDPNLYLAFSDEVSSFTMLEYNEAKQRKDILLPFFSRKSIVNMQDIVQNTLDQLCDAIVRETKQGQGIDIMEAFYCFAMDMITTFCFARSMNCLKAPGFRSSFTTTMHSGQQYFPFFKYFPQIRLLFRLFGPLIAKTDPAMKGIVEFRHMLKSQVREVIQHPETLADAPHPIIYHELLREDAGRKRPSELSLRDEAGLLVSAGTDTVSNASTVGFLNLLWNKDIYDKLRDEIWKAWPNLEDRPRYEQRERLPYLTAVIKESLRLSHGVWHPMTRVVPSEGAVLSGEFIPGGTVVGTSNLFVHLNPTIFPDPHSFKPERWLELGADALNTYQVAFSKGPRSCLGINLAWCELYLVFANLIRRFELQLDGVSPADLQWKEYYLPVHQGPPLTVRATPLVS